MPMMTAFVAVALAAAGGSADERRCRSRFEAQIALPAGHRARARMVFEANSRDDRQVNAFLGAMAGRPYHQEGVQTPPDPGGGLRLVMPYTSVAPRSAAELRRDLSEVCRLTGPAVTLKSVTLLRQKDGRG